MKAIQYTGYGESDVLHLNEIEKPVPKENEVLIHISATTVNPLDMKIRAGIVKDELPVKEFPYTPGMDVAGSIEETGSNVTRFKAGDLVYALNNGGTYAEYVSVNEGQVAFIPQNLTINEAAALVMPLSTAYTFLVAEAHLQTGQKVLIQGAAGSVGQAMVQMAKELGAYVIGTASGKGVELLRSLGIDEAIDHKKQDFTKLVKDADLVIDLVGGETEKKSYSVLRKGGLLLSAAMPLTEGLAQKYGVSARFAHTIPDAKQLEFGKEMVENGIITPNIVKLMKLEDAAAAQNLVSAGGQNGKIVLTVN